MDRQKAEPAKPNRRFALLGLGALAGAGAGIAGSHAWLRGLVPPIPGGVGVGDAPQSQLQPAAAALDDSSQLSRTPVWKHETIRTPLLSVASASIAALVQSAAAEVRPVIASAARHSMGGQSIARDGLTITLDQMIIETDREAASYRVGGGTRWNEVIRVLDQERLLSCRHAVQQRFRGRIDIRGECPWLAGALVGLRIHGAVLPDDHVVWKDGRMFPQ
jgi:hypothetical protein